MDFVVRILILLLLIMNSACTLHYSITGLGQNSTTNESIYNPIDNGGGGSNVGPTIIITSPVTTTSTAPITFTVTSDKSLSSLVASQLSLVNASILSISGSGKNFSILVNPLGAGNVEVILEAGSVTDTEGKLNPYRAAGLVTYNLPSMAATLLKNINLNEQGSYPQNYTKVGSEYFFAANNGTHGNELWKTDGTSLGTVMVKDIIPGTAGSSPTGMVEYGGKLYFGVSVNDSPFEFWVSDGSDAGTFKVKDLGIYNPYIYDLQPIIKANGLMFFTAYDSNAGGTKLVRSDGTAAGTYVLRSDLEWVYLEGVLGNRLLFRADLPGVTGSELYYSEGTEATTLVVKDIYAGANSGYYGLDIVFSNSVALFIANDGTGWKLWRTDGTGVNTTVYDASLISNARFSGLGFLKSAGGNTYFMNGTDAKVNLGANPFIGNAVSANGRSFYFAGTGSGSSLFSTDGLTARNHIDLDSTTTSWSYKGMIASTNGVYFQVKSAATGWELYFHDGSTGAPVFLGDNNPGPADFLPYNKMEGVILNNKLIFPAVTASNGDELWISDGTPAGTFMLKDIHTGASSSYPRKFYVDGIYAYFYADNGINGAELWRTDGTAIGTVMVKNINLLPESSFAAEFTVIGSQVFFNAKDASHGYELWKTDGTPAGTVLVKDGILGSDSADPRELRNLNGNLVYIGADNLTYATLWRSDGSDAGTQVIKPGYFSDNGYVGGLTVLGSKAYFQGSNATVGRELFVTDGSDPGTVNLVDLNPGAGSFFDYGVSDPDIFLNLTQGLLYFVRELSANQPWVSDGTTNMSNNVILDSNLELARGFFEVGNLTYFSATDSSTGDEILYKSDGTPGGTTAVKNIEPGNYVGINSLSYVNSKLIFIATNLLSGTELWASDGTAIGTIMIKEFTAGAASSSFLSASKEPLGTKTFFVVDDGINGFELWVTDGTAVGTQLLKDINPGAAGSFPNDFVKIGSYVYFSAETAANGRELWRTDGTSMGTVMVVDLVPGAGSSSPEKITAFGTKLIFTAKDALGDREVHLYEP